MATGDGPFPAGAVQASVWHVSARTLALASSRIGAVCNVRGGVGQPTEGCAGEAGSGRDRGREMGMRQRGLKRHSRVGSACMRILWGRIRARALTHGCERHSQQHSHWTTACRWSHAKRAMPCRASATME